MSPDKKWSVSAPFLTGFWAAFPSSGANIDAKYTLSLNE